MTEELKSSELTDDVALVSEQEAEGQEAAEDGQEEQPETEVLESDEGTEEQEATEEAQQGAEEVDEPVKPHRDPGKERRIKELDAKLKASEAETARLNAKLQQIAQAPVQVLDPMTGTSLQSPSIDDFDKSVEGIFQFAKAQKEYSEKSAYLREQEVRRRQTVEVEKHLKAKFNANIDKVSSNLKDIRDVIANSEAVGMITSQPVHDLIMDSPRGPEIAYYLTKNPDAAERLASLPDSFAAKELGKLELIVEDNIKPKRKTNAPKPISRPSQKSPTVPEDLNKLSIAELGKRMRAGLIPYGRK